MAELELLSEHLGALLQQIEPNERRKLATKIGRELRKRQHRRILQQKNPDGSGYIPRKTQQYRRANKPLRFIYRKANGRKREVLIRSYQNHPKSYLGFDQKVNGIRTFFKSRVEQYLPVTGSAEPLRNKKNRIKNKMFMKIKNSKYLQVKNQPNGIAVGFTGIIANIARVHQFGLNDKPGKDAKEVRYAQRELLGFTSDEADFIEDEILKHLKDAL